MDELRSLDEVAFVRFASVYRSFKDLEEFRAEIERISLKAASPAVVKVVESSTLASSESSKTGTDEPCKKESS